MTKFSRCTECGETKARQNFARDRKNLTGVSRICTACTQPKVKVMITCKVCKVSKHKLRSFSFQEGVGYSDTCKTCEKTLASGTTKEKVRANLERRREAKAQDVHQTPQRTGSNPFDWRTYQQPVSARW